MKEITEQRVKEILLTQEFQLLPTQNRLSLPIIIRLYNKMCLDIKLPPIKTCDNLIIDGHHRYISTLLSERNIEIEKTHKSSATELHSWKNIELVDDYESDSDIMKHNLKDANYNGITIEKLLEMLS